MSRFKQGDTIGNDRTADMNRVERAIVRGIRDEFGQGQQHQVGGSRGFNIAVAGTDVVVSVRSEPVRADGKVPGLFDRTTRLPTGDHDGDGVPHPYVFDSEWDGLCATCGGEQDDPLHVGLEVKP